VEILLARMLRLDRTAPRISSARKLVPFLALPNGTSDILAVARRPQMLGGAGPEPSHKSLAGHPPPQRRKWGRSSSSPRIRVLMASLLLVYLFSGCGIIMVGDPVKEQDLSSVDDADENLKAIRAMLADQASQRPEDKMSGTSTQPAPSDATPSLIEPPSGRHPAPSPSSLAGRADVPAKLPSSPPVPDGPATPDRPVPAYTIPAPVGPDYSGSIRCAPDGMGGQRCAGR
jgi:hypothetical protein